MPSHTRVTDPIWKRLLYKGRSFSERHPRGATVQPSVFAIFYSWQAMYCANSWQGRQIMIVVDLVFQQQVILKSEVWKRLEQFNVLLEEVTTEPQTTWPISRWRSTKVYSWCRQRKNCCDRCDQGAFKNFAAVLFFPYTCTLLKLHTYFVCLHVRSVIFPWNC